MFTGFDFEVIWRSLPYLFLDGMVFTVQLTLLSAAGGVVLGTLIAMMRLSSLAPLSLVAAGYVNLVRSLPLVLVIFWFYFLIPWVWQWVAYYAEIMRAGIQSVRKGQVSAGYALGMTYPQVMGYVVLPQAFRNMLPVLLTQTIILFQDTSLVYVLSITDFLGAASKIANRDFRPVEMYLFAAVVYFAVSFTLSSLVRHLQTRIAIVR
jgi:glutamate/aspartate transport system permease protein